MRGNGIADLCAMPERAETRCHPVWRDTSGKDNAGGTTGGAALIIINREETQLDHAANVVLHADVAEALPAIAARLPAVRAVHMRETKVT